MRSPSFLLPWTGFSRFSLPCVKRRPGACRVFVEARECCVVEDLSGNSFLSGSNQRCFFGQAHKNAGVALIDWCFFLLVLSTVSDRLHGHMAYRRDRFGDFGNVFPQSSGGTNFIQETKVPTFRLLFREMKRLKKSESIKALTDAAATIFQPLCASSSPARDLHLLRAPTA